MLSLRIPLLILLAKNFILRRSTRSRSRLENRQKGSSEEGEKAGETWMNSEAKWTWIVHTLSIEN